MAWTESAWDMWEDGPDHGPDPRLVQVWDDLAVAVAERRAAAGLAASAPFSVADRSPAREARAVHRLGTLWERLRDSIAELAPLFLDPDALDFNASHPDRADIRRGDLSALSPAPASVAAWLNAPLEPHGAMPPFPGGAASLALRRARIALDRMRYLNLEPVSAPPGWWPSDASGLCRSLVSLYEVHCDAAAPYQTSSPGGIWGAEAWSCGWAYEALYDSALGTGNPFHLVEAHPCFISRYAMHRCKILAYASMGGVLRVHTVHRANYAYDSGTEQPAIDPRNIDQPAAEGGVGVSLDARLRAVLSGRMFVGYGGPAAPPHGWSDLGECLAGEPRIVVGWDIPQPPATPVPPSDDYEAVVAANWPNGPKASSDPDDVTGLFANMSCLRSWRIDAAVMDLSGSLSKVSHSIPPFDPSLAPQTP